MENKNYIIHPDKYAAITIIILSLAFAGKPDLWDTLIELIQAYIKTIC